jgi:hypothetical protein
VAGTVALVGFSSADAHHTAASFYDLRKTITVDGTITAVKLANPHSYFRLMTDDGADWAFESSGSFTSMRKEGWSTETIPVGSRVRVSGAPSRDGKLLSRYNAILVYGGQAGGDALLYAGGRAEWVKRARELGHDCPNRVMGCVALSQDAVNTLRQEFHDVGLWSSG